MTLGIGAICDGGKSVIIAADRLLTLKAVQLELETDESKLLKLSDRCVVSQSTDAGDGELMEKHFDAIAADAHKFSIRTIAERIQRGIRKARRTKFWNILRPDLSFQEMVTKLQSSPIQVQYVVGGIDDSGIAQLFYVDSENLTRCNDKGFALVGSGGRNAIISLSSLRAFSPNEPLPNALFYVYEAKKLAEHAVGVGPRVDIAIIERDKGVRWIRHTDPLIAKLEEIRKKHLPVPIAAEDADILDTALTQQ